LIYRGDDDDEVTKIEGTVIDWKDGKDVTKKKVKKKQKNKKTGETRTIIKSVTCDSFFNFFESKEAPEHAPGAEFDSEAEGEVLDRIDEAM
jgi:nucleosome assembly protein 1-like 1